MIEKLQLKVKGGVIEPSSDIPLNWRDMQIEFGYKLLYDMARLTILIRNKGG